MRLTDNEIVDFNNNPDINPISIRNIERHKNTYNKIIKFIKKNNKENLITNEDIKKDILNLRTRQLNHASEEMDFCNSLNNSNYGITHIFNKIRMNKVDAFCECKDTGEKTYFQLKKGKGFNFDNWMSHKTFMSLNRALKEDILNKVRFILNNKKEIIKSRLDKYKKNNRNAKLLGFGLLITNIPDDLSEKMVLNDKLMAYLTNDLNTNLRYINYVDDNYIEAYEDMHTIEKYRDAIFIKLRMIYSSSGESQNKILKKSFISYELKDEITELINNL